MAWARAIRAGDWLTRGDMMPYHSWHGHIARAVHAASGSPEPFDERVARRIWRGWLGEHEFYEDPFYPYFLAVLGGVSGESIGIVYLVQALLGVASVVLIVCIAHWMFDATVALVAGLMAALFGPLVFFETLLLRSVLNTFTGLASVAATMLALREPPPRRRLLGLGLVCGISFLVQATAIVYTVGAALLVLLQGRRALRPAATALGWMAAGFLIAVSPLIARNVAVGARPFGPPAHGPVTFVNQNAADAQAEGGAYYSVAAARIMSESHGRFWPAAIATVKTHPSLGSWLGLCAGKVRAFWAWYEIPNNANYYYFCLYARVVCAVAVTFAVVGPLALVGIVLALRRGWVVAPALLYVASGVATAAAFTTLSRLRLPYACASIPFAAYALVVLVRALRGKRFVAAAVTAAAVAVAASVLWRPLTGGRSLIWPADYAVGNEIVLNLARRAAAEGDLPGATRMVEEQIGRTEPEGLRSLTPGVAPSRIPLLDAEVSASFAALHDVAAQLHAAAQDRAKAEEHARRARVLHVVAAQWQARQPPR